MSFGLEIADGVDGLDGPTQQEEQEDGVTVQQPLTTGEGGRAVRQRG